ncbi:WecB/TagA/CpsF family glycosyltransferase [uncultured Sphaerochaeta sp.]|uniref:WecB/TagA/CpsF family glycosyltransferase n=1 Tax=uncultured Sphaerochaeta sp. TaxID=886478 RepID=UPI0029C9E140|nr:WecB/TagA/CpsF family glycosyltransferase [uncultured Sphaerochaeta sp.]
MSKDLELLGLSITNITKEEALDRIDATNEGLHTMHFVNAHCINVAAKDAAYHAILAKADALFADGSGIRLAGSTLGCPIVDNVNGTDLFPLLCSRFAKTGKRIFLLGSAPGVAEKAARWAEEYTGSSIIAGTYHGYFKSAEESSVIEAINASGADLLLVALGVPRQEKWIESVRSLLQVPLCMGVGALFDFYSGTVSRAPLWMRKIGLEWVWRLLLEPGRMWRRYIVGNVVFIVRLMKLKIRQGRRSG